MEQHLKILGILFIVRSVLSILIGLMLLMLFSAGALITHNEELITIFTVLGTIVASFFLVTGIPGLIGGWGLLARKKWSRILVIIMAIINLFDIPLGTALGIYALWVLFKPEAEQLLTA